MHAFLEWFCEHGGMVRIGPKAFVYDDDYTFSVGFKIQGNVATLTGTHAPAGGITTAHKRAACEALERKGYKVTWKHREPNPDPALSISGVKPMRTVMPKTTFSKDHLKTSHVGKGKYDRAQTAADYHAIGDAIAAGKVDVITRRLAASDEASDGSGRPVTLAVIEMAHND